jgi:hypothetical protein
MYAGWMPSREGEPWEDWEDAKLLDDRDLGCSLLAMTMRARRSFEEVEARLAELEKDHPPKIRPLTRSHSFRKL